MEKLSFAKIAATGVSSSGQPTLSQTNTMQEHEIPSSPQDGADVNVTHQTAPTALQTQSAKRASSDQKRENVNGTPGPQVHIQSASSISPPGKALPALDGMLMPMPSEEDGTQVSSSTGSRKPPSVDGKSTASGTTFVFDEKESLRPDDSASLKATEDEDVLSPPDSGVPDSRTGSEDGVQAFRDQLREISGTGSSRTAGEPQDSKQSRNPTQGVLYIPPPGSGVGNVPTPTRANAAPASGSETPPDPKLLEALDSPKDRIMVLKLEQDIVDFIKDAKESSLKLPQTNAFYRMLAHKLADYYMLGHIVDESTMAVRIYKTETCRLPQPLTGIATPSTAASTPPPAGPQMKILRRGIDNAGPGLGSGAASKANSENGDSGDDKPKPLSREEREARYEEARKRIMGSAKPSDSPEQSADKDVSRTSSAAGRNASKKKQRVVDDDDDFEARSAYSAYYPPSYTSSAPTPAPYGYQSTVDARTSHYGQAAPVQQSAPVTYQQHSGSAPGHWPAQSAQSFQSQNYPPNWTHHQQSGYDLSGDFQRTMSLQGSQPAAQPGMQQGYQAPYGQQYGASQHMWPQQPPQMPNYPTHQTPTLSQPYPRQPQMPGHGQQHQYQFGQLPSQHQSGRPANMEHPLPGSYKGKHFNPNSQTFVPAQTGSGANRPFTPQGPPANVPTYDSGYGVPGPFAGISAQPQSPSFGTPHGRAASSHSMTHPLPQPVFPNQASPHVPLPPKPDTTPQMTAERPAPVAATTSNASTYQPQPQSSIAKWGAPPSLPAKPPPSVEPYQPAKFAQTHQQGPQGPMRMASGTQGYPAGPNMAGVPGYGGQSTGSPGRF